MWVCGHHIKNHHRLIHGLLPTYFVASRWVPLLHISYYPLNYSWAMIFMEVTYVAMLQVTVSLLWTSITMVRLRDFIIAFGTHLALPHHDCSCFSNLSGVAFACASFRRCWCEVLCSLYLPFANALCFHRNLHQSLPTLSALVLSSAKSTPGYQ